MKKKLIFCFDLDNTICTTKKKNYVSAKPKQKILLIINKLHDQGHYIKIFTARYMGRNKESISKVYKKHYKTTYLQLKKWNLKFDKLIMGKPSYDFFYDDKNIELKKNWHLKLLKYLPRKSI